MKNVKKIFVYFLLVLTIAAVEVSCDKGKEDPKLIPVVKPNADNSVKDETAEKVQNNPIVIPENIPTEQAAQTEQLEAEKEMKQEEAINPPEKEKEKAVSEPVNVPVVDTGSDRSDSGHFYVYDDRANPNTELVTNDPIYDGTKPEKQNGSQSAEQKPDPLKVADEKTVNDDFAIPGDDSVVAETLDPVVPGRGEGLPSSSGFSFPFRNNNPSSGGFGLFGGNGNNSQTAGAENNNNGAVSDSSANVGKEENKGVVVDEPTFVEPELVFETPEIPVYDEPEPEPEPQKPAIVEQKEEKPEIKETVIEPVIVPTPEVIVKDDEPESKPSDEQNQNVSREGIDENKLNEMLAGIPEAIIPMTPVAEETLPVENDNSDVDDKLTSLKSQLLHEQFSSGGVDKRTFGLQFGLGMGLSKMKIDTFSGTGLKISIPLSFNIPIKSDMTASVYVRPAYIHVTDSEKGTEKLNDSFSLGVGAGYAIKHKKRLEVRLNLGLQIFNKTTSISGDNQIKMFEFELLPSVRLGYTNLWLTVPVEAAFNFENDYRSIFSSGLLITYRSGEGVKR